MVHSVRWLHTLYIGEGYHETPVLHFPGVAVRNPGVDLAVPTTQQLESESHTQHLQGYREVHLGVVIGQWYTVHAT